jgi:hypothetical protein
MHVNEPIASSSPEATPARPVERGMLAAERPPSQDHPAEAAYDALGESTEEQERLTERMVRIVETHHGLWRRIFG